MSWSSGFIGKYDLLRRTWVNPQNTNIDIAKRFKTHNINQNIFSFQLARCWQAQYHFASPHSSSLDPVSVLMGSLSLGTNLSSKELLFCVSWWFCCAFIESLALNTSILTLGWLTKAVDIILVRFNSSLFCDFIVDKTSCLTLSLAFGAESTHSISYIFHHKSLNFTFYSNYLCWNIDFVCWTFLRSSCIFFPV